MPQKDRKIDPLKEQAKYLAKDLHNPVAERRAHAINRVRRIIRPLADLPDEQVVARVRHTDLLTVVRREQTGETSPAHPKTSSPEAQMRAAGSAPEPLRFMLKWTGGEYKVSKPNIDSMEVVDAAAYDALRAHLDTLLGNTVADLPPAESYYVWRELAHFDGEDHPRLIVPWSDPRVYEHPMDLQFDTPEDAVQGRKEWGGEGENWILCHKITRPVARHRPNAEDATRSLAQWLHDVQDQSGGDYARTAAADSDLNFQQFLKHLRHDAAEDQISFTDAELQAAAAPLWKEIQEADGLCVCSEGTNAHEHCKRCDCILNWNEGDLCRSCETPRPTTVLAVGDWAVEAWDDTHSLRIAIHSPDGSPVHDMEREVGTVHEVGTMFTTQTIEDRFANGGGASIRYLTYRWNDVPVGKLWTLSAYVDEDGHLGVAARHQHTDDLDVEPAQDPGGIRIRRLAICPSCESSRPYAMTFATFAPGSVCPSCRHVEPEDGDR